MLFGEYTVSHGPCRQVVRAMTARAAAAEAAAGPVELWGVADGGAPIYIAVGQADRRYTVLRGGANGAAHDHHR